MANFWPKPWTNPLWKNNNFSTFSTSCFDGLTSVFSFYNIVKHIFQVYIALKQNMEKWPIFDQNHGLTPLEKRQFLDFLNFFFLGPKKAFFRCIIS